MFQHLKNRKLYRSPKDALVFGIAAGLAQYFQIDVIFVRLLIIALAFFTQGWPVLLAYVAAIVLMPIDPAQDTVPPQQQPKDVTPPAEPVEHMDNTQNM